MIQLLIEFERNRRKSLNLTQNELAKKAGVGLRFIRATFPFFIQFRN